MSRQEAFCRVSTILSNEIRLVSSLSKRLNPRLETSVLYQRERSYADPHKTSGASRAIQTTIGTSGFLPCCQLTSSDLYCLRRQKRMCMRIRPFSVELSRYAADSNSQL